MALRGRRLSAAVVLVASHGRRLRAALCRHRLRVAVRRRCLHAASQDCGLRAALCGVIFVSPGGCRRTAIVCTCCRTAVVFASPLLSGHCHLRCRGHCHCLVTEGRMHIPSNAPTNGGGCAGAGRKRGDGHAPASARTLFAHKRGQGAGGVSWAKGGRQHTIGGGGRGRGHVPSRAPANGGGCAEEGCKRGGGPAPV
jgi:hypothetical protein